MNYDSQDLAFSWSGDLGIGLDGDLMDTSDNALTSLVNDIRDITKSEFGDWKKDQMLGANLSDFIGEANNRTNGAAIEDRVKSRLVSSGLVKSQDVTVRVTPIHINQVMINISVNVLATSLNGLTPGQPIVVSMVYNTTENGIFVSLPNTLNTDPQSGGF
jgi:signal transduction histidine kinase